MTESNTTPPPLDLASLGVCGIDKASENAFARILLLGASKVGKTTCVAGTAPKPLIINCDGDSAVKGAKALRHELKMTDEGLTFPCYGKGVRKAWPLAIAAAEKLVKAGAVRTVLVDTLTVLQQTMLDEMSVTLDKYDLWNAIEQEIMRGIRRLFALDAHVFIVCHILPSAKDDADDAAGILPAIKGSTKVSLPAIIDDWVLIECDPAKKPMRQFIVGPQTRWNHNGRNVRRSCAIEATVPLLFSELGITL